MSERRFTTTVDPALMTVRRLHPTNYPIRKPPVSPFIPVPEARIQLGHNGWNWRRTLDDEGFRQFDVLAMLAQEAGLRRGVSYRVGGDKQELAHLAFVLHLLGYAPTYDLTIE
jgi:hypothetical protein